MSDPATPDKAARSRFRWLWLLVSFSALLAVLTLLWEVEDTADVTDHVALPAAPIVSVIEVDRTQVRATISVFSELKPRWDAQIRTAVSGRVVKVHEAALAGTRVKQGTPLFAIQRTPFETAVAEAEFALEQARLIYVQAQNDVAIVRRQFERDAREPPNELALKLPQLRIAERGLDAAERRLAAARHQLAETAIIAPFSGFVTERMVSLGQTVAVGEALLHLSDDRQFELVANLSQADWAMLDHPVSGTKARIYTRDGEALGTARIRQGGGFLDPETRQVRVFLDVSGPSAAILSGDFVQVVFDGRFLDDTLTIPSGALTQSGHVWFVGGGNMLERHEPEVLFRTDTSVILAAPDGEGPWRVAQTPLAFFLPGQRVTPRATEG